MSAGAIEAGRAYVRIYLQDQATRKLRKMSRQLSRFSAKANQAGRQLMTASLAIAAPVAFATRTYAAFADQMAIVLLRSE